MANQINIDIGAAANDGTGDPLRTAFNYVNLNFANVWDTGLPNSNVQFNNNRILTVNTNANLVLAPNGTGVVQSNVSVVPNIDRVHNLGSVSRKWDSIYANYLNINNLDIDVDLTVGGNLIVQGNIIQIGNIVTDSKTIQLANTAANTAAANGSGITVGANDNIATLLYNSSSNVWTTNIGISVVGNITAPYFIGNGSLLTGITSYSNANVAAYLPTYSGNISAGYINVTNDVFAKRGSFTGDPVTGDASLYIGSPSFTNLGTDVMAQFTGNVPSYAQINLQNYGNSNTASADYIITADNGNDTTHFLDLGLTGSNWDGTQPNSLGNRVGANDGYLYVQDGDFVLGTSNGTIKTWKFDQTGNLTVPGDIIPAGNNTQNLGSATNQWNDLYISNATIFMNGVPITLGAGNVLTVDGEAVLTNDSSTSITTTGNITADYFIGDGSQLTNLPSGGLPLANGTSNFDIAAANGNATVTTDGSWTWTFGTDGNLTIPNDIVGLATIDIDNRLSGNTADIRLYSADDITLQGRDRSAGSGTEGGDINIYAGDSAEDGDSSGGDIQIFAGDGGAANVDFGGAGGFITIRAGQGGSAIGDGVSRAESGGSLTLEAGDSGGNNGNIDRGADGGDVFINAGESTGNLAAGGDIVLTTGPGGSNAPAGNLRIIIPSSDLGSGGTWTFGHDGNLTLPNNGNVNGADGQFARFQSLEEGVVRSGMILNPGDGLTRLESWDNETSQGFTTADWTTGEYIDAGGYGQIAFTDAPNILNLVNSVETSRMFLQVNGGAALPYDGYSGSGNNITFFTPVVPSSSPETVTSFTVSWSDRSRIEMDYDEGELNIQAQDLDINITSDQSIDIQSRNTIRIENSSTVNSIYISTDTANAFRTWSFDVAGNLNLPAGGVISEGPSPSYLGNAVTITPANGGDPNQQLKIYPTVAEGNHLHLTSGNLAVTDVFLGDDRQYIRTTTTEGMIVGTGGGEIFGGYVWSFEENGNLIFPDGASIGSGAFTGTASSTVSLNAFSPDGNTVSFQAQGNTSSAVISIFSNAGPVTSNWTFTTAPLDPSESLLYIPNGGTITTPNATDGEGGKNIFIQAGASDPETWNSNPGGELMLKGGYGSFGDGGGGPGGNVNIEGGASSDSHAGNVNITCGLNSWVFDYSGNVTIPGNINAVVSSPAPSLNGFNSVNAVNVNASGNITGGNLTVGSGTITGGNVNGAIFNGNVAFGTGTIGGSGNIDGGNISTSGRLSATGNIVTGGQIQSSAFTGGNISWSANNQTDFQGAIKVGGTGVIKSPSGASSITLNSNGANIPILGVTQTIVSTSTTTGALIVSGGAGIAGNVNIGGLANVTGNINGSGATFSGNVTAQNFVGNISITGNIQGTTANVSLVAGSYTYTFDNAGVMTLPAPASGNEGGEIQFTQAGNSTLSGNTVTVDSYVDQIRFFEGGGTARGAYIDLSQAAAGVGTLLNNRVSGFVDAGTFVTMDNIKATVTSSSNRGLSLATTTGSITYNIGGTYGGVGGTGGFSVNAQTLTTTPTSSIFAWNFGAEGEASTYVLVDKTNNRSYRITLSIGPAYLSNMISIERLV